MTVATKTISALAVAATLLVASESFAAQHRLHVKRDAVTCPADTRQVVENQAEGATVEYCVDSEGRRHGYFLRWQADSKTWAELGHYHAGRKDGRWIAFSSTGRPTKINYFAAGTIFRPWEFLEEKNDEAVATR